MRSRAGKLNTAEFDRVVLKFAEDRFLAKPYAARRADLSVSSCLMHAREKLQGIDIINESSKAKTPLMARLMLIRAAKRVQLNAALFGKIYSSISATITLFVPSYFKDSKIRLYVIELINTAKELNVFFSDINIIKDEVSSPLISISAAGMDLIDEKELEDSFKNYDFSAFFSEASAESSEEYSLITISPLALEGTILLLEENKEKLLEKYANHFLDDEEIRKELYPLESLKMIALINKKSEYFKYGLLEKEGGIYGALWNLSEETHLGLVVDGKSLATDVLTVEITETLEKNPFYMMGGSIILATNIPEAAVAVLAGTTKNINCIGKLSKSNDKLITNNEEVRYIDAFKKDTYVNEP